MNCPDCGYVLSPFDKKCPKCAYITRTPQRTTPHSIRAHEVHDSELQAKTGKILIGSIVLLLIGGLIAIFWDKVGPLVLIALGVVAFCGFIWLMTWAMVGSPEPPQKIVKTIYDRDGNVVGYIEEDAPVERTIFFFWWS